MFLCPHDNSQGGLKICPCLSVHLFVMLYGIECNQLLPQFLMDLFETLHTCCGHIEDVNWFLVELELISTELQPFELSHFRQLFAF